MKNIMLIIEYDGTNYCGWQKQKNSLSIQDKIEMALVKLTGEDIKLHGSGRTDAGVHAFGQTANFNTESKIPPEKFCLALNSILPDDISVINSFEVNKNVHARFSAVAKHYRYVISNRKVRSALMNKRACFIPEHLDVESMIIASNYFIGTHDFKAFMAAGSSIEDTVRTIYEAYVEQDEDIITIDFKGNGFLYNMVRIMAGTLVSVGKGRMKPEDVIEIIKSKDRNMAGKTLPPEGLYLVEVFY